MIQPSTIARLEDRLRSARWYKHYWGAHVGADAVRQHRFYVAAVKRLEQELAAEMAKVVAA